MRRREVSVLLVGAMSWPLVSRAQSRRRRLGLLGTTSDADPGWPVERAALVEAMGAFGWREGDNLQVDERLGGGDRERLDAFAKELVRLKPDVLLARSTLAVRALLAETRTIPIVFVSVSDPVGESFAATLARPGGNLTGFTNFEPDLAGKWLELLKEVAPDVRRVGLLFNPTTVTASRSSAYFVPHIETAGQQLGLAVESAEVRSVEEIDRAARSLARGGDGALLVIADVFTVTYRARVIEAAARHRLPTIYPFRNMAAEGGLISYGVDVADLYRRSAAYIDRILNGALAGELPIQMPTRFELVINLRTARAMALSVPPALLARADEVIE
jgi:putative ABC transport system substrate-binding protein